MRKLIYAATVAVLSMFVVLGVAYSANMPSPSGNGIPVIINGITQPTASGGTDGQVPTWGGSTFSWQQPASGFTASGDLDGSSTRQTVIGLQGRALSATAPTQGQAVVWDGAAWGPAPVPLAGDIDGSTGAAVVVSATGQGTDFFGGDSGGFNLAATELRIGPVSERVRFANESTTSSNTSTWNTIGQMFTPPNSSAGHYEYQCVSGSFVNDSGTGANGDGTSFNLSFDVYVTQPGGNIILVSQSGFAQTDGGANQAVSLIPMTPATRLDGSISSTTTVAAQALTNDGGVFIQLQGPNTDPYHYRCEVESPQQVQ